MTMAPINVALARGHRLTGRFVSAEADLYLAHKEDADIEGAFSATCLETGDALKVNGWLFEREDQP